MGKRAVIISGGSLDRDFALRFLNAAPADWLIGADRGIEFFREEGLLPTHIVGDFDSGNAATLEYFERERGVFVRRFRPEKDFTDTQLALELALELGSSHVDILGCFGSRIDHVTANLRTLRIACQRDVSCFLLDAHNRIRLIAKPLTLRKQEQYGRYVSLFAFGAPVTGLTLTGFAYPLENFTMTAEDALGVSNEILETTAKIEFISGNLLVMESRD